VISASIIVLLSMQSPGLPPDWELKPNAEKIAVDVARLRPLLERLQPAVWIAAGAPTAYQKQWRDCLEGIGHVQETAQRLAANPARLSLAVETLVRLESLLEHAGSLAQAVRRYQNPAVAEVLEGEAAAAGAARAWLRQHVQDLALQREQELAAAESEAQRCRVELHRPGARKP
jgi:hypothetical protein